MGAHRVALVPLDGSVIEDVQIAWGDQVVRGGGRDEFDPPVDAIVDVISRD
jgi:hypothetical protein